MKLSRILTVGALATAALLTANAKDGKGIKIYINPGHGGHTSNDRNVVIYPYVQGDPEGYWESNSNFIKGLALRDMLEAKGYSVVMSRLKNDEEDDLALGTIVRLSNESKAQMFFSIHSNATGVVARRNFPLMLFRGYDNEPVKPNDKVLCQILNKYLLQNQATYWTSTATNVRGDFSFYPSWGTSGLGALRGQQPIAMLSEGSFHDYIPETYRLMNPDFCWLEAWHFRKTVDEYFGVDGLTVGCVAGRLNDTRVPREGDYLIFGDDKLATIQGALVELIDASGNVVDKYTTETKHTNGFYLFKDVKPGTYTVRASVETHYTVTSDPITVVADEATFCNMKMSKVRNTPPVVESYQPVWKQGDEAVLCNTPVVFQFNWDMDMEATEKAFSITPAVKGTFSWEDLNHRMIFTPSEAYLTNTEYTVTLSTDAQHAGGLNMEKPVTFSFLTTDRNFMEILGYFPKDGEKVHYSNMTVEFRFDKQPFLTQLLNQLKCVDSKGNAVQFNVRKKTNSKVTDPYGFFRVPVLNDLTIGETYTVTLDGSFGDKDGITIQKPIKVSFTAVDATEEKANTTVMANMSNKDDVSFDETGSTGVEAAAVASSTDKVLGNNTLALSYTFAGDNGGEARYIVAQPENAVSVNAEQNIGVYINGDLTGNEVYLELTSDVSTINQHLCKMDFLGWRYIEVPAAVEGASTLTAVKVAQVESQISHKGTLGIGAVLTTAPAGVNDITVASGVTVHPNPASEYLVASANAMITNVELVSLNGTTVAKADGNVINVSDIAEGQYIMLVNTAYSRTAHKVAVKH